MRTLFRLLCAAFLTTPVHAQTPPSLTLEEARTLPTGELAEIVLRQLAEQVRAVTRPNYDSALVPDLPLTRLTFATAPRSGWFAGLCEATVIHVDFFDTMAFPARERNLPVRAREVTAELVHKVIGDVTLPYVLGFEDRARQNVECAELTQVIPPEQENMAHRAFFRFRGDLGVAHGIAVLQRILRGVSNGSHTDHECVRTYQGCTDSAAVLRALSLDDLLSLRIERNPNDPSRYSVSGQFLVGGSGGTLVSDEVTVDAMFDHSAPHLIRGLGHTSVRRTTLIRD